MKKRNNKVIILTVAGILFVVLLGIFILNYTKDDYSFSILEKKWINDNASNILDVSIYNDVPIYKVSKWQDVRPDGEDVEERVLYNCIDGNQEKYSEYYEELYFVSLVNDDYGRSHYFASTVDNDCKVVTKTFYRTKVKIKF